jgi:hypothetical protein
MLPKRLLRGLDPPTSIPGWHFFEEFISENRGATVVFGRSPERGRHKGACTVLRPSYVNPEVWTILFLEFDDFISENSGVTAVFITEPRQATPQEGLWGV